MSVDAVTYCDATGIPASQCGCPVCDQPVEPVTPRSFVVLSFDTIEPQDTHWLIPDLIPDGDPVVLVGEEGIGKGLWWISLTATITTATDPGDVLLIVAEDDPAKAIRPRLDAAGADTTRVHIVVQDADTLTGHPMLPTHSDVVEGIIRDKGIRLVIVDPWVSTVPGMLSLRDTQQARQALDPITRLARRTGVPFLLIAHTNRSTGTTRDSVSLTAVLRQVARIMILVLEDPSDASVLYVGVDKANNADRAPATKYRKTGDRGAWRAEPVEETGLTIREWHAHFRHLDDGRTTDRWDDIITLAARNGGGVTRAQVVEVYAKSGSPNPTAAADKAIARWTHGDPPRLARTDTHGVFVLPAVTP